MTYADVYLAERDTEDAAADREHDRELVEHCATLGPAERTEHLLRWISRPEMAPVIRFAHGDQPGSDIDDDATWAVEAATGRRRLAVQAAARFGVELGQIGQLMNWIDGQIGRWPAGEFNPLIRARVDSHLDARRRGRERGRANRAERTARGGSTTSVRCGACWALRHPLDSRLRTARARTEDPALRAILDIQIAEISAVYAGLAAEHPPHEDADLVTEVEVGGSVPSDWKQPVPVQVVAAAIESPTVGESILVRQVADASARFSGTRIALRPGERWLIYGDRQIDGAVVPLDGSRRLSA